jgi:hypothetical protein
MRPRASRQGVRRGEAAPYTLLAHKARCFVAQYNEQYACNPLNGYEGVRGDCIPSRFPLGTPPLSIPTVVVESGVYLRYWAS